jgi:hypothetical protein
MSTPGTKDLSSSLVPINHKAKITVDDFAFKCEISDRRNGRSQTIMTGTLNGAGYKTGGVPCDLTALSSPGKFPLGSYRVIMQPDTTGTYYAVYNHATKKVQIFSALGSELTNATNIKTLSFPFLAVGE